MPEPNLPPLRVNLNTREDTRDVISVPLIKDRLPELPEQSRTKLIQQHELKPEAAIQLVNEPVLLDFFQSLTSNKTRNPTKVANLLINDLLTILNKNKIDVENCPVTAKHLADLVDFLLQNKINLDVCKSTIDQLLVDSTSTVEEVINRNDWFLITDETVILDKCKEVIENNPKIVKQYKDGKVKVFNALLGLLVKSTDKKFDMTLASKKMEELLKK